MTRSEQVECLVDALLEDMPEYGSYKPNPGTDAEMRAFLRALMNVRPPKPLKQEFLKAQDALLSAETRERGVVRIDDLKPSAKDPRLYVWQGDITRLGVDAIVNAANSALLGCFVPGHHCIDNAIHSAAGLQLREACNMIITRQGHDEDTGLAKMTRGYNLPARYVLHTVGPIVNGPLTEKARKQLASCYVSCLEMARSVNLKTVAFCCISTGVFGFPNREAAIIAVETVRKYLDSHDGDIRVIFNVFLDKDASIYNEILG